MKKIFLLSFFLISFLVKSQPLINKYTVVNYDSIAKSNVGKIVIQNEKDGICKITPTEKFKITISAKLTNSPIQNGIYNINFNDIIFSGSYDIRARFYITPDLKIFQRVFITGVSNSNIFYTTGFI